MDLRLPFLSKHPSVAVIRLQGMIAATTRGALSDHALGATLDKAFARGKPAAVALVINSPGGSPVQSSLIATRIRRLSEEKKVPVHAFVEDVAASGGYWIACAADEIHADPASIVGSIGVISAGFGLQEFIDRHGIERRVHTAGESKSQMDPFKPEDPDDVARLERLLEEMHTLFIDHVKARRGDKLADAKEIFTGEYWLAARARDLGLIDGIGHVETEMKRRYGDKVRFRRYGARKGLLRRIGMGVAGPLVGEAVAAVEERAAYARFGL